MTVVGDKCEIRIYTERTKKDGNRATTIKDGLGEEDFDSDNSFALVCKRVFDERNVLEKVTLQINSPHLLRFFRDKIGFYPTVPSDFESPFEMESPFRMLYHYWDELSEAREEMDQTDDEARMHLNLLLDFIQHDLGPDKAIVDSMLSKGHISFSLMWTIFRPGCLVYTAVDSHPWLLKLEKTAYEENKKMGKFCELHCIYTDYDGKNVGLTNRIIRITQKRHFAAGNPCQITKLPAFPRAFLEGQPDLEERLSTRGQRFLDLQGVLVKRYDGLAQYLKDPPLDFYHPDMVEWEGVWLPYTETGRIVLDRKTFQEENYLEKVLVIPQDSLSYSERILCPPYVYGFSLSRKDWCRFNVDPILEVNWNANAFDALILKEEQKLVLQALVTSHAFPDNPRDQPMQKGKGLVILLHGSPGSGKTLTAESAAEITSKALISATIGELNKENRAYYFEYRLKSLLQYATIWKAIVLLDEADVFLEARIDGPGDSFDRNALVAVFLKHLEYFSGIVFLTSNRVGVFDEAMKSRIHLALEYAPPEIEMRRSIWLQSLRSLPANEVDFDFEEDLEYLVKDRLNGREIANAVNTARTLARYKGLKLDREHIETVLKIRREFDASIHKMKALRMKEKKEGIGGFGLPIRQNSLVMSGGEESAWLPQE